MTIVRNSIVVMAMSAVACLAQSRQFEVASVKPSPTPPTHRAYTMNDSTVDLGAVPLSLLVQLAYRMEPYQVSAPDWMSTTRFDVLAKLPAAATKEQIPEMLQALLADRFGLAVHREAQEQQVYALAIGKDGPKLKEGAADNNHPDMAAFLNGRKLLSRMSTEDGFWMIAADNGRRVFVASRISMPELARTLMPYLDNEPVLDMTGLKGFYDVSFEVPVTARANRPVETAAPADPDGGISIFASIRKLGLSLEKRKAPVEHLVIDHAEKTPKENQ